MTSSYERFAGLCAVLAGLVGLLYAIAFIIIARSAPGLGGLLSALFLMVGSILSTAVLIALYRRLRETEPAFALWGFLLAVVGAVGAAIHGGYDLANAIHPPASVPADLPSQIDPRGLLTFGFTGIGLFIVAWLIGRNGRFPVGLAYVGYLLAILLVILYLGRLIILTPTSPLILIPALLTGFVVNPAWYIWLGLVLLRGRGA